MKTMTELLEECRNLLRSPIWARSNGELLFDIDAYLAMNGWIDPKNELPKERSEVLVLINASMFDYRDSGSKRKVGYMYKGSWFDDDSSKISSEYVLAWQPLPKGEYKNMNCPNDAELRQNLKDYGIPKDTFDYITKMAEDHGVKISIEYVSCNPGLSLEDEQEEENRRVNVFNDEISRINERKMIPRQMTIDMKRHIAIILTGHNRKRKIILSIPFVEYNSNGELMANTTINVQDSIHEDFRGMCELCVCLLGTVDFWQYFIRDDIYQWAERHGFTNSIQNERSHLYQIFSYRKDVAQSLIDMFGYDTMEKAMDDLSKGDKRC